jgi:hypothetical protein
LCMRPDKSSGGTKDVQLSEGYYSRIVVRLAISLISIGVFRAFALVSSGGSDLELASSNQLFLLVSGETRPV